jgi:hypothetical protein
MAVPRQGRSPSTSQLCSSFVEDGAVEDLGPDQCSLEAGSWSWTALAASFNRFDTDIDVVGPAELTHAFAQLAARNAATAAS